MKQTTKNHSRLLPPSGWELWSNCAGSSLAQEHMPDLYSQPAEEGTAIHACAEACFKTGCNAKTFIGHVFNNITIDDELAKLAQGYVDFCLAHKTGIWWIEQPVEINEHLYGTFDFASYDPDAKKLTIIDGKFGRVPVNAQLAGQLWIYALGVAKLFNLEIESITFKVYQPLAETNEFTINARDFYKWVDDVLFKRVDAVLQDNPPRTPGAHCKNCKAKITCPEYLTWCNYNIEPPFPLTNESIGKLMEWLGTTDKLKEQVIQEGSKRLKQRQIIPGCKLVRKTTHEVIKDKKMLETLFKVNGVSTETTHKKTLKTPKQLRESLPVTWEKIIKENTHKPDGELVIAILKDARKAVHVPSAAEVFNQ